MTWIPWKHGQIISRKLFPVQYGPLYLNGKELKRVDNLKQLGLKLNEKMTWDTHIRGKCVDANKRVNLLKRLSLFVPMITKLQIYISFIRPLLEYAAVVFDNCDDEWSNTIERVQRDAAISICDWYPDDSSKPFWPRKFLEKIGRFVARRKTFQRNFTSKFKNFYNRVYNNKD